MRHIGSLALALVLGPVVWLLTGYGLNEYARNMIMLGGMRGGTVVSILALLVAGALYTLLVSTRISPVGPVTVGLGYLGLAVWFTVDQVSFLEALPQGMARGDFALAVPAAGFVYLLAVPLLATVASPRRWRRYDRPVTPRGHGGYPVPPGSMPLPAGFPGFPAGAPGYPPAGYPPPHSQPAAPAYAAGPLPSTAQFPAVRPEVTEPSWAPPPTSPPPTAPAPGSPAAPPVPAAPSPDTDATTVLAEHGSGATTVLPPPSGAAGDGAARDDATTMLLAPEPPAAPAPPVVAGPPVGPDATAALPTPAGPPATPAGDGAAAGEETTQLLADTTRRLPEPPR